MKKNYKKICLLLIVLLVSCFMIGCVEAAVTGPDGTVVEDNTSVVGNIINMRLKVIEYIGGMAASGLFYTVTSLINVLSISMFLALYLVLGVSTGEYTHLPMPDTIVFNKFAFFDPNFINPANNSLIKGFGTVLEDLFSSFNAIAIAIFIIAAMVTGLKMALSTIASKKAQYKEAALKWLTGFLVLICLKWIIAGIFYINEYLVSILASITSENGLMIPIYITDAIPIYGKLLSDLWKGLQDMTGLDLEWEIAGYLGIIVANLCKSIGGNIVASIVGFVLMGQTLTIVGSYLKRTFMCILLGVIAPLIVAVDTVMSATGKQSTIFKNWLQNFSITVFMQTIHAMYMLVTLNILSGIYSNGFFTGGLNETQASIVTIVLTTGLVKLEKLIKSLFGIGDSFAGDLKSGAKGMVQAMGAVKGIAAGAKAVGDNAGKARDAANRKKAAGARLDALKSPDRMKATFEAAKEAKANGNMAEYNRLMKEAAGYRKTAKESGMLSSNTNTGSNKSSGDVVQQTINNQTNQPKLTREQQIQQAEADYAKAHADFKSASLAKLMGPANLAAGIGLGIGMGDDIGEALFKGGHITAGLDFAAEKIGYRAADKDRKTFANYEANEGQKYRYTPSDKIMREKSAIEQRIENPKIYIDPIAVGREVGKQFKGIGDVLSDTMKKELKLIDKNLDESQ